MLQPQHIGVFSEALYKVLIDLPLDSTHQRANFHSLARNAEDQYSADDAQICHVLFVTLGHLDEGTRAYSRVVTSLRVKPSERADRCLLLLSFHCTYLL